MKRPPSNQRNRGGEGYGRGQEYERSLVPPAIDTIIRECYGEGITPPHSPHQWLAEQLVDEKTSYRYPTVCSAEGDVVVIGDTCGSERPEDWCVIAVPSGTEPSSAVSFFPEITQVSRYKRENMRDIGYLLPDGVNERIEVLTKGGQDYYIDVYHDLPKGENEAEDDPYRMIVWCNDRSTKTLMPFLASWRLPEPVEGQGFADMGVEDDKHWSPEATLKVVA